MRKLRHCRRLVDILSVSALLFILAAGSILVVLFGASAFLSATARMERSFSSHTALAYVTNKIRHFGDGGAVYPDHFGGIPSLVLEQWEEGQLYQTWLYPYDGSLCELFARAENVEHLTPDAGRAVLALEGFDFTLCGDRLLLLTAYGESGESGEIYVSLLSAPGEGRPP